MRSYDLGPYFCDNPHHALLHHILGGHPVPQPNVIEQPVMRDGMALEFGVGEGHSLRCISRFLPTVGFDSFEGLPEDWRPGFTAGMFKADPPYGVPNTTLVVGRFEDTVANWVKATGVRRLPIRLVHIDCDLYSSTKTVLDAIAPLLKEGTVVVFDEWHGFYEAERYEQRAWRELADETAVQWEVLGHGVQQWAVRIT